MKPTSIFGCQQEFATKLSMVARYFMFGGELGEKLNRHVKAIKILGHYRREQLIYHRAYFMYILPYISKALSVPQKHHILIGHYAFLREAFSREQLQDMFKGGITCYAETNGADQYRVMLQAVTSHLEFEGSLNLVLMQNGLRLYTLSFTFVPGTVFGQQEDRVIFISAIQGSKNESDNIRNAIQYFKSNNLPVVLIKILEAFAVTLGLRSFLGITAEQQLSFKETLGYERFYNNYDAFWMNFGGTLEDGYYRLNLPLQQKSILQISQTHRNRSVRKRKKLEQVYSLALNCLAINLKRTG